MNIGSICTRRVASAPLSAPLSEVVALMRDRRVGMIVVTRSVAGRAVICGVITDRDIMRAQLTHVADFSQLSTADTMSGDPLIVTADEDIGEAMRRMRLRGVRRAPVVDAEQTLIGAVSIDDLLAAVARDIAALAAVVTRQAGANPVSWS